MQYISTAALKELKFHCITTRLFSEVNKNTHWRSLYINNPSSLLLN